MYVIQIVGYKNSGKTTLINHWINYLTAKDLHVATIKHHGHGGEPDQKKNTDSFQHIQSGASLSTVKGEQQFIMTGSNRHLSLAKLFAVYELLAIDVILVEGYKMLPLPKVVLLRGNDERLLNKLENIKFIDRSHTNKSYLELFQKVETRYEEFAWSNIKNMLHLLNQES